MINQRAIQCHLPPRRLTKARALIEPILGQVVVLLDPEDGRIPQRSLIAELDHVHSQHERKKMPVDFASQLVVFILCDVSELGLVLEHECSTFIY